MVRLRSSDIGFLGMLGLFMGAMQASCRELSGVIGLDLDQRLVMTDSMSDD